MRTLKNIIAAKEKKIKELQTEIDRLRGALEIIAVPKLPGGHIFTTTNAAEDYHHQKLLDYLNRQGGTSIISGTFRSLATAVAEQALKGGEK